MKLKQLAEVIWRFYQEGRTRATAQTFREADVKQYVIMTYGNLMRSLYYANRKSEDGSEYYFFSGDLDTKQYVLLDADMKGMRRAVITDDVVRLPKNDDIVNVYPVSDNCGKDTVGEITQVQPGEENFYLGPDFRFFQFFVQKGKGINTYNVPPCVKMISVERIYISDDMEIAVDLGYDIANQVLGIMLRVPGFNNSGVDNSMTPPQVVLRSRLQQQQSQQPDTNV